MVAIFKYENGLKFTGWVANSEKEAWDFLDEQFGVIIEGVKYKCNHEAFYLQKAEMINAK